MKKKLLLITAGLVVFVCTFVAWRRYVEFIPPDETSVAKLPSPNAYDFYVKAGKVNVRAPSDLDPIYDSKKIPEEQWKTQYPIAKREEWLRKNNASLRLLREGFKYPCRIPPNDPTNPTDAPYTSFREMARQLSVESRVYSEKGQWGQAADSALDCLHLGYDLSKGGVTLNYLVGGAVNAIGRATLLKTLPHLNSNEAQSTAKRLESIIGKQAPFSDILRETKQVTLQEYRHFMQSPEWSALNQKNALVFPTWKERWKIYSTPRRTTLNSYDDYMNANIAMANKPYNGTHKWPALPAILNQRHIRQIPGVYATAHLLYTKEQATDALLLTSLAWRAFALDHQRDPQTLQEMVPRYLKTVPTDPFGNSKPLRYQPQTTNFRLYSVGPDGINNNGVAIEDKKLRGKRAFYTYAESKGDFVAGINY